MDELQAGFDEGPCLEAQESGTVIRVPDVRYEARWPKYMAQVRHHGLHSVLAVPLVVGTTSTAAMNFYSHDVGAFNGAEGTTAKHYADLAQNRCSQDEAVKILKSASNHRNLKLRVLAEQLVTSRGHQTSTTAFEP